MKRLVITCVILVLALPAVSSAAIDYDRCLGCHELITPGIVKQWYDSKHSASGVTCVSCHEGRKGDPSQSTARGAMRRRWSRTPGASTPGGPLWGR
jgi:hypothetical protein